MFGQWTQLVTSLFSPANGK